jgi:hypothetical protein
MDKIAAKKAAEVWISCCSWVKVQRELGLAHDYMSKVYHKLREMGGGSPARILYNHEALIRATDFIAGGFMWATTPEGHSYWSQVYHVFIALRDGLADGAFAKKPQHQVADIDKLANELQGMEVVKPTITSGRKRKHGSKRAAFIAHIQARGYKLLASGYYSEVYSKGDKVIKVNKKLDLWPAYIKWAKENGYTGKYAPNVHALKVYRESNGSFFYVATMDKLVSTLAHVKDDTAQASYSNYRKFLERDKIKVPKDKESEGYYVAKARQQWAKDRIKKDEAYTFLERMRTEFKEYGYFDAHANNWMTDKQGKVILVDPLSGDGDSLKKYLGAGVETLRIKEAA